MAAATPPRSAAYRRTSVPASVADQETPYGPVEIRDGPVSGELHFQQPTYSVVNVHVGLICQKMYKQIL